MARHREIRDERHVWFRCAREGSAWQGGMEASRHHAAPLCKQGAAQPAVPPLELLTVAGVVWVSLGILRERATIHGHGRSSW